jgi:transcriptional regulator with XRE-family HTH domain
MLINTKEYKYKENAMEKNIGTLLRNRRIDLEMTMKKVAVACGVSKETINRWETGEVNAISRGSIYLLTKVLYLPVETIFGIETQEEPLIVEVILTRNRIIKLINGIEDVDILSNIKKITKVLIDKDEEQK